MMVVFVGMVKDTMLLAMEMVLLPIAVDRFMVVFVIMAVFVYDFYFHSSILVLPIN